MGKPPTKRPSQNDTTDIHSDEGHDLEHEIERQIGEIIPKKHRDEVVRRVTTIVAAEQFSGPIAHPRHLQQYEMILPGSADRIISMAEQRNQHHIEMDRKLADAEIADVECMLARSSLHFSLGLLWCLALSRAMQRWQRCSWGPL